MSTSIGTRTAAFVACGLVVCCLPASAQEADDTPGPPRDPRTIYVPYDNLEAVFDELGAGVFVPYEEWLRLWRAEAPEARAIDAVITAADYTATVEGDLARIRAELTVNVLGEPWAEVPIRFGDAAVGELAGDGEDVLLRGTGDGTYALLLGQPGEQQVVLELVARVRTSPDGREFSFATPTVGITNFELVIPEADQTVEITPHLVSLPVEDEQEGQTRVRASLGSTGQITARWRPRAGMQPEMELLTSVTNHTQVSVEDGLVHTDAYLTYDVLRGSLSEVRIAVPEEHRILDVAAGSQLKSWRTETDDETGSQMLVVELLGGVEQQVTVEVHTERPQPEDAFYVAGQTPDGESAGIHALGAVRESGQIALRHGSDLTLTLTEQQGVVRIETSQVAERIRSEGAIAFKFFNPQFTLQAQVEPIEPRIVVEQTTRLIFLDDELRLQAGLTYTIERAGVFQLALNVPEPLEIDDVQSEAMKEYSFDETSRTLTVSLLQRTQGQVSLHVSAHQDYEAGVDETAITLPILEPQSADRETGAVFVYAKEAIEVITDEEGVEAAQPLPAPAGEAIDDARLTAAWRYTRRPVTIPVTTRRKSARMNAHVATTINVLPQTTEVATRVDFVVQFAGLDTFQFMLPETVSDSAQIEAVATDASSPAIRQQTASDPTDGWVTWTIEMQRPVVGTQRFSVTYDIRPDAEDDGDAEDDDEAGPVSDELTVELLRPLAAPAPEGGDAVPISQLRGEVAVKKDQALSVTAAAEGGDVEPIDVRELTLLPQTGSLAYRYFDQPDDGAVTLSITRTRHEIEEVVSTVVRKMLVEIFSGEDGMALYGVRMQMKTTERQRLLIDLPIDMELIELFVDGREVKLEQAGDADESGLFQSHYLNVARTRPSDEEFAVSMQFRWRVSPPLGEGPYVRGSLELPLPVLGGRETPAAVQQLRVALWVPRDFALVGEPEEFVLDEAHSQAASFFSSPGSRRQQEFDAWIEGGSVLDFGREGYRQYVYSTLGDERRIRVIWWDRVWMTIIVSAAIALLALVLGRTSWENKLFWLVLAAFIVALIGLWDSHWLAHALAAARFGLAFLIGWWLITGIFRARHALQTTGTPATTMLTGGTVTPAAIPPPDTDGGDEPPPSDAPPADDSGKSST